MRSWLVAVLVAAAGCYRGAAELPSCTIRCDQGCPEGTRCSAGLCTTGAACTASDAGGDAPSCGGIGETCCATGPACIGNGYCASGTCAGDCAVDVALGRRHSCLLRYDHTVWCSGDNGVDQLGTGSAAGPASAAFVQVVDAIGPISDATAIGAGNSHTCAIRTGGEVWCWGNNGYGQLGDNTVNASPRAVRVVTMALTPLANAVSVTGGDGFSCALDNAGTIWCWGRDSDGQLGDNTMTTRGTAAPVATLTGATSISLGILYACAVQGGAHVYCWGYGGYGEIGDGGSTTRLTPVPVLDATEVSAGGWVACARLASGEAECWGRGNQSRLGNGSESNAASPTPVLAGSAAGHLQDVASIGVGGATCAVTTDHRVLCWGVDPHGQVGVPGGSMYPVEVKSGVDRVYTHYAHVCAHGSDGNLWCWGRNTEGELGDGTFVNVASPEPIASICR